MRVIEELATMPEQLEEELRDFPRDRLTWTPPDWNESPAEHFTALSTVCHLRDIERDGYHVRFARTVSEVRPHLSGIDGYALERERRYHEQMLEHVLGEFRAARLETLRQVRTWGRGDEHRSATFDGYGVVTAESLLHVLRSHDLQHLAGLHWLRARLAGIVNVR